MLSIIFCIIFLNLVISQRTFNGSYFEGTEENFYENSTLLCDEDADCEVWCLNSFSCANATIICPESDNTCSVYFGEETTQEEVSYSGFQSTVIGGGGDLNVTAYGHYGFNNATLLCPDDNACTLLCSLTSMNQTYTSGPCAFVTILGGTDGNLMVHADTKWSIAYSTMTNMSEMSIAEIFTYADESIIRSILDFDGADELHLILSTELEENVTVTFTTSAPVNLTNATEPTNATEATTSAPVNLTVTTSVPVATPTVVVLNETNMTEVVSAHIRDSQIYGAEMTYFFTTCYNCRIDCLRCNWISLRGDNFENSLLFCPLDTEEYPTNCMVNTTNGYIDFEAIYSIQGTTNLEISLNRDECNVDQTNATLNNTEDLLAKCNETLPLYCIVDANTTSDVNYTGSRMFDAYCEIKYYEDEDKYLCMSDEPTSNYTNSCGEYEHYTGGNVTTGEDVNTTEPTGGTETTTSPFTIVGRQAAEGNATVEAEAKGNKKFFKNLKRKLIIIIPVIIAALICCLCCCYLMMRQMTSSRNNRGECSNSEFRRSCHPEENKKLIPYV